MNIDEIPRTWATTTIGDLVESKVSQDGPAGPTFRYIDIGSIDNVAKRIVDPKMLPVAEAPSRARQRVHAGDVLVSMTRPNLNAVARVGPEHDGSVASTGFDVLRPKGQFSDWLFSIVRSHDFVSDMTELVQGALYPAIRPTDIRNYPIALPPEAEQRRIVAKLDALQTRTRLAREALAAIPALLDHYRQSILKTALSGNLVGIFGSESESADQSLSSIRNSRINAKSSRAKAAEPYKTDELFEIPSHWSWASLDELCQKIVDGTHFTPEYTVSGVPFISVKDIRNDRVDFSNCKFISHREHAELSDRCRPQRGDLLITKSGTIGRTAIVDTDEEFSLFVSVALMKPSSPSVNMSFVELALQHWLNSIDVGNRITGSAIKNLHLRDMRVLAIPFPPLREQAEIVRKVRSKFKWIEKVRAEFEKTLNLVDALDQSLLATAFRGELVPQDPTDEPASVLLDRIRAARAQTGDAPRTRSRTPKVPTEPTKAAPQPVPPLPPVPTPAADPYATLLSTLRQHGSLASADAQIATGLDAAAVRPLLQRLVAEGAAKVEGQKRGTRYVAT